MHAITPLSAHGLLPSLKRELPQYLSAAQSAPSIDKADVEDLTKKLLLWWHTNGSAFPTWALAALSPNSASCERVLSLVKSMFGEQQLSSLADLFRSCCANAQGQWAARGLGR